MKKLIIILISLLGVCCFTFSANAYIITPKDTYGEPAKSYDDGYEDGFEAGGGRIVYKTREVSAKEYIADHETRFRELYITFLLVLGICVVPVLIVRYAVLKYGFDGFTATVISVVYNLLAGVLITYIMYRIDYLVPCTSIVILWGIICKRILTE